NGCIDNYLIKRVSFRDDRSGVLELSGDRKVLVTLRNRCSGIRQDGYVHKPVNNRFCEGAILRVMRSGGICVVDSLEPYVELDGATAPDGQDPRAAGSRSEGRRVGKGGGRRWRRRDEAEMVRREHGGVGLRGAAGV